MGGWSIGRGGSIGRVGALGGVGALGVGALGGWEHWVGGSIGRGGRIGGVGALGGWEHWEGWEHTGKESPRFPLLMLPPTQWMLSSPLSMLHPSQCSHPPKGCSPFLSSMLHPSQCSHPSYALPFQCSTLPMLHPRALVSIIFPFSFSIITCSFYHFSFHHGIPFLFIHILGGRGSIGNE